MPVTVTESDAVGAPHADFVRRRASGRPDTRDRDRRAGRAARFRAPCRRALEPRCTSSTRRCVRIPSRKTVDGGLLVGRPLRRRRAGGKCRRAPARCRRSARALCEDFARGLRQRGEQLRLGRFQVASEAAWPSGPRISAERDKERRRFDPVQRDRRRQEVGRKAEAALRAALRLDWNAKRDQPVDVAIDGADRDVEAARQIGRRQEPPARAGAGELQARARSDSRHRLQARKRISRPAKQRRSNLTYCWQVSHPIFALVKLGSNVMAQTSYFQAAQPRVASHPRAEPLRRAHLALVPAGRTTGVGSSGACAPRRNCSRKLEDYDKHMLRDMGLMRARRPRSSRSARIAIPGAEPS